MVSACFDKIYELYVQMSKFYILFLAHIHAIAKLMRNLYDARTLQHSYKVNSCPSCFIREISVINRHEYHNQQLLLAYVFFL